MVPVSQYQQTSRAIKYFFLIICLVFTGIFLVEAVSGKSVNIVQYIVTGFSLCLFYLLLLPLPVSQEIRQVVVLCAALPAASLTASFTLRYNPSLDAQFDAAGSVLISHLLCIATIPLWALVLR